MLYGIDISQHQSKRTRFPLTTQLVRDERLSFAIIKATQGYCAPGTWRRPWNFRDSWFVRHLRLCRDAGVPVVGAYHYLLANTEFTGDGRRQAEFFVRAIERNAAGGDGLLLAVDFEGSNWVTSLGAPVDYSPRWRDLRSFIERFRVLLPEHPLLLYTSPSYASRLDGHDLRGLDDRTHAWNAAWADARPATPGFQSYRRHLGRVRDSRVKDLTGWRPGWGGMARTTILQFTDGALAGDRHVDADAFDGSLTDLEVLAAASAPADGDASGRPAYRRGYNRLIDAVVAATDTVAVGDGDATFQEGVAAAGSEIATPLADWKLKAPG